MPSDVRPYRISEYPHFSSRTPNTITIEYAANAVKSGLYAEEIERLQHILRTDGPDAYREAKKTLPGWTFGALFVNRRARNPDMLMSGLTSLDFDHLTADRARELLDQARSHPNILLAFRSPSHEGVKIVIALAPVPELYLEHARNGRLKIGKLDAHYQRAQAATARHFERLWGVKSDPACKDVSRLCFVSADELAHFNPQAEPYHWEEAADAENASLGELERRFGDQDECLIDHDATQDDQLTQMIEAATDIRYFNGELHYLNGALWQKAAIDDVRSSLARIHGMCPQHAHRGGPIVAHMAKRNGYQTRAPAFRTVLIDGELYTILNRRSATYALGRPPSTVADLLTPAQPDHLLTQAADFDIGRKPDSLDDVPRILREIGHYAGIQVGELRWSLQWLGTALGDSLKAVLFILTASDAGKSIIPKALSAVFGRHAVFSAGGSSIDQYYAAAIMRAAFAIAEEAQDTDARTLSSLKTKTGGGIDAPREMQKADFPTETRSSFIMIAERDKFRFNLQTFKGGWMNRWNLIVGQRKPGVRMPGALAVDLSENPVHLKELAWAILSQRLEPNAKPTYPMLQAKNAAYHAMFDSEEGLLEFASDGRLLNTQSHHKHIVPNDVEEDDLRRQFEEAEPLPW